MIALAPYTQESPPRWMGAYDPDRARQRAVESVSEGFTTI